MTGTPTTNWGFPTYDGTEPGSLKTIANALANASETALDNASTGFYLQYATKTLLTGNTTAAEGQHATVTADSTPANNGDYVRKSSAWVYVGFPAIADIATFSTGWAATNAGAHKPRVRRNGAQVFLYGAVTASSGASGNTILTIPSTFQPPTTATRFVGTGVSSAGTEFTLAISSGVLQIPSGYIDGSIAASNTLPLMCSWWMD